MLRFLDDVKIVRDYELQLLKDLDNSTVVIEEFQGDGYWKRNVA